MLASQEVRPGWSWEGSDFGLRDALSTTRLIKASSLVELAKTQEAQRLRGQHITVMPRCQDWPLKDCASIEELTSHHVDDIVVLSICWLDIVHPDLQGEQLAFLAGVFRLRLEERGEFFVLWDYCSLPQKNLQGVDDRSEEERARFRSALGTINTYYAHPLTTVLLVTRLPDDLSGYENIAPYTVRGWTITERTLSSMVKVSGLVLDLGALHTTKPEVISATATSYTALTAACHAGRSVPMAPSYFASFLRTGVVSGGIRFTNKGDVEEVCRQYEAGFRKYFALSPELRYDGCDWSDGQLITLIAALAEAANAGGLQAMKHLVLDRNALSDRGAFALAEALKERTLPTLILLSISHNRISPAGEARLRAVCVAKGIATILHSQKPEDGDRKASYRVGAQLVSHTWDKIVQLVPITIIHLADYISDVFVVIQFHESGLPAFYVIASIVAISFPILVVMCWMNVRPSKKEVDPIADEFGHDYTTCQRLGVILLAPFNLHLVFMGYVFATTSTTADDGADPKDSQTYSMFVRAKCLETGIESVILAMLTVGALVHQMREGDSSGFALYSSSIALSCLSMCIGYFAFTVDQFKQVLLRKDKPQVFVCMFIHLAWTLSAIGSYMGAASASGMLVWVAPGAIALIGQIHLCSFVVPLLGFRLATLIPLVSLTPFCLLFGAMDWAFVEQRAPYPRSFAAVRRVALITSAVASLYLSWDTGRAIWLVVLAIVDAIASLRLMRMLGWSRSDPLQFSCVPLIFPASCFKRWGSQMHSQMLEYNDFTGHEIAVAPAEPKLYEQYEGIAGKRQFYDVLEGFLNQPVHLQEGGGLESSHLVQMASLRELCSQILEALPDVSEALAWAGVHAFAKYVPMKDVGSSEAKLRAELQVLLDEDPARSPRPGLRAAGILPGSRFGLIGLHPMRVVSLPCVLAAGFGAGKRASTHADAYNLSKPMTQCSWYVSHSSLDPEPLKKRILRNFLCLHQLLANILITLPLVALFLVPLGIMAQEHVSEFPWFVIPAIPLAILLSILTWIVGGIVPLVPTYFTPWALSSITLWVDHYCIDSSTPEMAHAGIASYPLFMSQAERMVALVSPGYWGRLRCVYELAHFCHMHAADLDARLLLLSLEWSDPTMKDAGKEPMSVFAKFECRSLTADSPNERGALLAAIRAEWGSEDTFDSFIRSRMPQIYQKSRHRYHKRFMLTAEHALQLALGG